MFKIKYLSYTISLLLPMVFFSCITAFNIEYLSSSDSPMYIYYHIVMGCLIFFFFLKNLFLQKKYITKKLLYLFVLLIFFSFVFFLDRPSSKFGHSLLFIFYSESFFAILIAYDLARNKTLPFLAKWIELIMVFISLILFLNIPKLIAGTAIGMGSSHQSLAYTSAFMFSLNLFFILFGKNFKRFALFRSNKFRVFSFFLLVIQLISCFVSGGRGGGLLLIISTVYLLYLSMNLRRFKNTFLKFLLLAIGGCILYVFLPDSIHTLVNNGTSRTFSYLTEKGIDMSQTSNRDVVYNRTISAISDRPILGYGIFKYTDVFGIHPHNFFLEILLQGGFSLLIFMCLFLFSLFTKLGKIMKLSIEYYLLIPFILYWSTMLLFSGTYMLTPLFWFVVVYVLVIKIT